jgi:hypothetical protein
MDIVKVIAILMIIFVTAFGGILLVHTSRLEKEIREEILCRKKAEKVSEDANDEV